MPTMTIEMMINKGDKSADPVDQFSTTNNEPTYNYSGDLTQLSPREAELPAGDERIIGRKRSLSEEDDLSGYIMSVAAELGVPDEEALKNIEILKSKGVNMSTLQILEQKLISDWGLHFSLIITAQNNIKKPKKRKVQKSKSESDVVAAILTDPKMKEMLPNGEEDFIVSKTLDAIYCNICDAKINLGYPGTVTKFRDHCTGQNNATTSKHRRNLDKMKSKEKDDGSEEGRTKGNLKVVLENARVRMSNEKAMTLCYCLQPAIKMYNEQFDRAYWRCATTGSDGFPTCNFKLQATDNDLDGSASDKAAITSLLDGTV